MFMVENSLVNIYTSESQHCYIKHMICGEKKVWPFMEQKKWPLMEIRCYFECHLIFFRHHPMLEISIPYENTNNLWNIKLIRTLKL